MRETFLNLVRLGIGRSVEAIPEIVDWEYIKILADQQGLSTVVLDGIEKLPATSRPPQEFLLEWIGESLQNENLYTTQQKAALKMADLYHENHIRTYVLKGAVIAECYPKPQSRLSSDMDCFLLPEEGDFDAWSLGNDLIKAKGFEVLDDFYKNSKFLMPDLTVENHQFFTPFRGNDTLKSLEKLLQKQIRNDKGEDRIEGTCLCRPPVMTSALFIIEHAYSHFLHEGLTWRHVLDWMMFSKKHEREIDWKQLDAWIEEFGFRMFYESYYRLGKYLVGELRVLSQESEQVRAEGLKFRDSLMLKDIWAELDVHETVRGIKGKLALAGNTWRARWKYRHFSNISMIQALWIQVKGFLFEKNPSLN